jgi:hypothetical protein
MVDFTGAVVRGRRAVDAGRRERTPPMPVGMGKDDRGGPAPRDGAIRAASLVGSTI